MWKTISAAVRVTYLNVQTGEERAGSAFTPGQLTLNVQISADKTQEVEVLAEAGFTGTFEYRTEPSAKVQHMRAQRSGPSLLRPGEMDGLKRCPPDGMDASAAWRSLMRMRTA